MLRADCVCLRIWRVISKRVAGGIVRLKGSEDSKKEMLFSGNNVFVCDVVNLTNNCLKGPNLIEAFLD
jgi:hypothetical protein